MSVEIYTTRIDGKRFKGLNKIGDVYMTRDEAIAIEIKKLKILDYGPEFTANLAAANIDALIELGLLKVEEEPKQVYSKPVHLDFELIVFRYFNGSISTLDQLKEAMNKAGLKVVRM